MTTPTALPPASPDQPYVTISPLRAGSLTLPERFFVHPADPETKKTVPSLAFLITHPGPTNLQHFPSTQTKGQGNTKGPFRLMLDLGLRSSISNYTPPQQKHLRTRGPYTTAPGVAAELKASGVDPADVDAVLFSHVHYDHHGDPGDFPNAHFLVGSGAMKVLKDGLGGIASHQHFDPDLLPTDRSTELPLPGESEAWKPLGPFPHALDLFGDGSVFVINAPGHLPGHVNLLCRTGSEHKWVYLGGDVAHDRRLLTGEAEIGTWENDQGVTVCIHLDKEGAEKSIGRVQQLMKMSDEGKDHVEVIIAHDHGWLDDNPGRIFPNTL